MKMRSSQTKIRLALVIIFISSLPLTASASTTPAISRPALATSEFLEQNHSEEISLLDSLREDVTHHPNDFITFETQSSANQFITEHEVEARRETERRVLSRGIFGYWGGKTLVVLPALSTATPR
jgi:hypothetical protein